MGAAYLMIVAICLLGGADMIFKKKYMSDNRHVKNSLNIYMLLAHPVAMLYFFMMAGGSVPLNVPTFWFSFAFAWTCMGSLVFTMKAYNRVNLVYVVVFSSSGAVILPFIFDLMCGEPFSVWRYCSILLRLGAVGLPLLFNRGKLKGFLICIMVFLADGVAGVIPKLYGGWDGVAGDASFCFWTNVIIMPIVLCLIFAKSKPEEIVEAVKHIRPVGYIYILILVVTTNLASLLSIDVMRSTGATMYSILHSSFMMVITALISKLIYKEELKKEVALSLVLSIGAIILGVM